VDSNGSNVEDNEGLSAKKEERVKNAGVGKEEEEESEIIKNYKKQQFLRNKRLFGGLNLHLNKAKSKL
jgi:hypothetical protein